MIRFQMPLIVGLLAMGLAGCAGLDLSRMSLAKKPEYRTVDARHPVVEVMCLWEPGEGRDTQGLPTRGFAGQVLFFGMGVAEPMKVNGDVKVYVFDDHGTEEERKKPIHIFEFPADVWNTYFRVGNVGASYQIFIPYTRPGSNLANCSLRLRYSDTVSGALYSKSATLTLPGTKSGDGSLTRATPRSAHDSLASSGIQQASYEVPQGEPARGTPLGKSLTMPVPSRQSSPSLTDLESAFDRALAEPE
ncbi:MAG: hypothetical protein KF777_08440 [Planctomycetaceae bacterium]|jgi:hypothetical protein|nr:hypothetical protein [Planctomycetaceae bacterium]